MVVGQADFVALEVGEDVFVAREEVPGHQHEVKLHAGQRAALRHGVHDAMHRQALHAAGTHFHALTRTCTLLQQSHMCMSLPQMETPSLAFRGRIQQTGMRCSYICFQEELCVVGLPGEGQTWMCQSDCQWSASMTAHLGDPNWPHFHRLAALQYIHRRIADGPRP